MGILPNKMDKIYPDIIEPFEDNPARSCPDLHIKNRKPTDTCFLMVFVMFFVVLFCFIGYCMCFGDIERILNGYDHCGSVCGPIPENYSTNPAVDTCYKERKRTGEFGPYRAVLYKNGVTKKICTDDCSKHDSYKKFSSRCLNENADSKITQIQYFLVDVSEDLEIYWRLLMYLCILSLALSMIIVILIRFCVGFIVWIIIIGVEMACLCATFALWVLWGQLYFAGNDKNDGNGEKNLWLVFGFAVGATILALVVGLIIYCVRKKIQLVIQLFEEAGKAIAEMPGLLLQPIVTFLAFAATISCWIYFTLWIASSGRLLARATNDFHYEKDEWMIIAGILNAVGLFWMIQFIIGCQHMIVAGAVSKWYFTREKSGLSSPVIESTYNLTRFHLGSVALGSFLITLVKILKIIVSILQSALSKERNNNVVMCLIKACLCICNCFLNCLEWIVKIFSENAYIIVAMYGHSFFKAGKQAFARIVANPVSFAAINSVGDFVLFLAKVLVIVVTDTAALHLLKGKGLHHPWVFMALVGFFSVCIAHLFITVYEMTIDTIFICFCEDSELNDGVSKPYYMSRGLMEYVENSKKAMEIHDKKKFFERKQLMGTEIPTLSSNLEIKQKHNV